MCVWGVRVDKRQGGEMGSDKVGVDEVEIGWGWVGGARKRQGGKGR